MVRELNASRRVRALDAFAAALAAVFAAPVDATAQSSELFAAHEPFAIELVMDVRQLCRGNRRDSCEDAPATLVHSGADGVEQRIGVRLRARGNWRNQSGNCSVPPLFVFFDDATSAGTPFEKQTMLPLTTHCREKPTSYEQFVLKEYLAYRIYNLITDSSLRVRLARVTYRDARRQDRSVERYAFFTEHFEALAARHDAELWQGDEVSVERTDTRALARVELFQYMIGNTDWSAVSSHNVIYISNPNDTLTAIPFDFDFSGLVNASYAGPPPQLPIRSVTERLYRGFCHRDLDWDALFAQFQDKRGSVAELVEELPGLEPEHRARARDFLGDFFTILSSPQERDESIVSACRPGRI